MARTTFQIGEQTYQRIAFGMEKSDWGADKPCRHCQAIRGQLHTLGCLIERCPRCDGQAMTCGCPYESGLPRRPISPGRQRFYKLFYLAILPVLAMVSICSFLVKKKLIGSEFSTALIAGVPILLVAIFWRRMQPIELSQIIPIPPPSSDDKVP